MAYITRDGILVESKQQVCSVIIKKLNKELDLRVRLLKRSSNKSETLLPEIQNIVEQINFYKSKLRKYA